MTKNLEKQLSHLAQLLQDAQNPKIVWEEMQILGEHAFDLQDEIMDNLDAAEEKETDITTVQQLFETREYVWDMMNQIALLEAQLKEKTFPDGKGETEYNKTAQKQKKQGCCCGHHQGTHCCSHQDESHECHCAHEHGDKKCCSGKGKKTSCAQKSTVKKTCSRKK